MTTGELVIGKQGTKAAMAAMLERDPRLVSPHTIRGYEHDLHLFEDWRRGRPLGKLLVEEYAAQMQARGKAPSTINRALAAIKWWARKVGDMVLEDPSLSEESRRELAFRAERAATVPGLKVPNTETGRHIPARDLRALMLACERDEGPAGRRDAALFAVAWATGARRAELARLAMEDHEPEGESEATLTFRKGKGGKTRRLPIFDGAADALADWLTVRGNAPGPVFCPIVKGGALKIGDRLTGAGLRVILNKRLAEAGIQKATTWHDFRRTFAGEMIGAADVSTTKLLMGHESADTTTKYDRRGAEIQRRALQKIHVPYSH